MISEKQMKILAFPYSQYDALICDGAIRSGKTSIMTYAFIDWAMRDFSGKRFGICGKTVDSAVKNIIMPYLAMSLPREKYNLKWRRSDKVLIVSKGRVKNFFEVFGGKDESSYTLIQGRTLAGVLLDETALMPRSFVEQALARCSVKGSRMWFNCNPEGPTHWFYKEWICKREEKNALRLHFELNDNPALSEEIKERYMRMYTGVFFDRYIRGLWVVAEGLVYKFTEENTTEEIPKEGEYYISCDYGTLNPFSAGLWCLNRGRAIRIREYYFSGREENSQKTDEEYYAELEKLAGDLQIERIIVDPSAASFIETIHRHRKFAVQKANNDVINGIITTARMLKGKYIQIHKSCENAIREFGLYSWDNKSQEDRPIKENDHAMDDIRYFCHTVMRYRFEEIDYEPNPYDL